MDTRSPPLTSDQRRMGNEREEAEGKSAVRVRPFVNEHLHWGQQPYILDIVQGPEFAFQRQKVMLSQNKFMVIER